MAPSDGSERSTSGEPEPARDVTATAVATARDALAEPPTGQRVLFGFDGYVDRVRELLADRSGDAVERIETLAAFSDRLADSVAAESSLSIEWRQRGTRLGGHTCHLARAFLGWDFDPVMVGMYGRPERERFADAFADCERHSLGEPGVTDAIEFADGKCMLIETGDSTTLDWATLTAAVSRKTLQDRLEAVSLVGVGYWGETPGLPDVLAGLADLLEAVADPPPIVLDVGDVRKLAEEELRDGRAALDALADATRVVLSANRAETARLASVLAPADGPDEDVPDDPAEDARDDSAEDARDGLDDGSTDGTRSLAVDATALARALDVDLVVGHGKDAAAAATDDETVSVRVPVVDDPELTTSAGDHFNAGLALALLAGLEPGPALAAGNAVARAFVRTGEPPTLSGVSDELAAYESALETN